MTTQSRRSVGTALIVVAAVAVALAWCTVLYDPYYRAATASILRRERSPAPAVLDGSVFEAKDPSVGSPLPHVAAGDALRRAAGPASGGFLVAGLGDCASCSQLVLEKLYRPARKRHIAVVAFSYGEERDLVAYRVQLRRQGLDVPVVRDAGRSLTVALNSYYSGRLYWYDRHWRLRWRERDLSVDNYLFQTGRFDRLMRNVAPL